MIHEEYVLGLALNGAGDTLSVLLAEKEGAEDQEIEGALKEIGPVAALSGRHPT